MAEIDITALDIDITRTRKTLEIIGVKVRKAVERKAMRAGNAVNVKGLRRSAPRGNSRQLYRSMGQQVRTMPDGTVEGTAGQNRKKAKRTGAVHIHLVDQDTRGHTIPGAAFMNRAGELIRGDMEHPGTDGQEFVEQTQNQQRAQALKAFADTLEAETDKAAASFGGGT